MTYKIQTYGLQQVCDTRKGFRVLVSTWSWTLEVRLPKELAFLTRSEEFTNSLASEVLNLSACRGWVERRKYPGRLQFSVARRGKDERDAAIREIAGLLDTKDFQIHLESESVVSTTSH